MATIALLFPGQGAQAVGMGKELYETLPQAKELFDRANEVLGYDLTKLCFEGPQDELNSTVHSQPGLYVASLAALEKLKLENPEIAEQAAYTAGLSLGEYTALVFAGVLDFETGLKVVSARGRAMQEAADASASGMTAILGSDRDAVAKLCDEQRGQDEVLQIANYLCPGNIVISGHQTALEKAAAATEGKPAPLAVAGAFHTSLMQSAVDKLQAALDGAQLNDARIPVVSNVDAQAHQSGAEFSELLVKQVVSPVLWEDSMRLLVQNGCDAFYEVGPGKVLRGLLRRLDRKINCENIPA